ncbi:hypothetical protein Tco_0551847 [Tanacetum coccineum]
MLEYETFSVKIHRNLNQLQWKLERNILYSSNPKSCLKAPFKEFFDSKEVNALDFHNKSWQKHFKDYTGWEPKTYRRVLLRYLDELDKLIDERQESLITKGVAIEACLVTEGAALEACLVNEGIAVNDNTGVTKSSRTESENSSLATPFSISEDENISSDKDSNSSMNKCSRSGNENKSCNHEGTSSRIDADVDIGPLYDSDTMPEVPYSNNDTFENVFTHGIQSHEQLESIPDTYEVNENNSNIIFDIPNIDPDRDKEEHDDVDYEQQRAFFASLINNLKCDVEKCNKANRKARQANALLTNLA